MFFTPLAEVTPQSTLLNFKNKLSTSVGAMVKGARCWPDEAEKPRFSSAAVQITYILAWSAKFLEEKTFAMCAHA